PRNPLVLVSRVHDDFPIRSAIVSITVAVMPIVDPHRKPAVAEAALVVRLIDDPVRNRSAVVDEEQVPAWPDDKLMLGSRGGSWRRSRPGIRARGSGWRLWRARWWTFYRPLYGLQVPPRGPCSQPESQGR